MIYTFIYRLEDIFRGVKQITSYLAERKVDSDGNSLFEELVFDEEYETLFKRFFFEAQAGVIKATSGYQKNLPVCPDYFEPEDMSKYSDFVLNLELHNFIPVLVKVVDVRIKEYLISYITYKWLADKLPNDAEIHLLQANACIEEIKSTLMASRKNVKIKGRYF